MTTHGAKNASTVPVWMSRFLGPAQSAANCDIIEWHGMGFADTPASDAQCRIMIGIDSEAGADVRITRAAFEVLGPPVAIACADWLCEWLEHRTVGEAGDLSVTAIEKALEIAPSQRYAALLVIDALVKALADAQDK